MRLTLGKDVPQVEFMYLVFTRMLMRVTTGNLGLWCLCYVFQALINSLVFLLFYCGFGLSVIIESKVYVKARFT